MARTWPEGSVTLPEPLRDEGIVGDGGRRQRWLVKVAERDAGNVGGTGGGDDLGRTTSSNDAEPIPFPLLDIRYMS